MNAEYGALANKFFRYFDTRLASAITLTGQLAIRWIEKYLNENLDSKYGVYVIYQDTDSIAVSLEKVSKAILKKTPNIKGLELSRKIDKFCERHIAPIIKEGYEALSTYLNCDENKFVMKREKIAETAFWTNKKRYAMSVYNNEGVEYTDPKISVVGLDVVRSTTPQKVKEYLTEIINILLTEPPNRLKDYVRAVEKKYFKLNSNDISMSVGINGLTKNFDERTGLCKNRTPIYVRGAIAYNKYVESQNLIKTHPLIEEGEKAKYVYLKTPNPLGTHVLAYPRSFPFKQLEKYIDYKKQFEVTFMVPVRRLAAITNTDIEKNLNRNSLEDLI